MRRWTPAFIEKCRFISSLLAEVDVNNNFQNYQQASNSGPSTSSPQPPPSLTQNGRCIWRLGRSACVGSDLGYPVSCFFLFYRSCMKHIVSYSYIFACLFCVCFPPVMHYPIFELSPLKEPFFTQSTTHVCMYSIGSFQADAQPLK